VARKSAGLVVFRQSAGEIEILLVHPGGPFWAKKDEGAWSIPKGEIDEGEDALAAARREVREEIGASPDGAFIPLTPVRQPGGKVVHAWAIDGDVDAATITSNTFEMEWPPRSGRQHTFPEVDRAAWFTISEARSKILRGQLPLLDALTRAHTGGE
jgi:predicted NUDIX family NTP pyrophosphohydrolase